MLAVAVKRKRSALFHEKTETLLQMALFMVAQIRFGFS